MLRAYLKAGKEKALGNPVGQTRRGQANTVDHNISEVKSRTQPKFLGHDFTGRKPMHNKVDKSRLFFKPMAKAKPSLEVDRPSGFRDFHHSSSQVVSTKSFSRKDIPTTKEDDDLRGED